MPDDDEAGIDEEGGSVNMYGIYHAVLLGVLSTNQFQSQNKYMFDKSDQREKMSDQVVSRIEPVMKWIKKHINKDHFCIPKI